MRRSRPSVWLYYLKFSIAADVPLIRPIDDVFKLRSNICIHVTPLCVLHRNGK